MRVEKLHDWGVDSKKAAYLQAEVRHRLVTRGGPTRIRLALGCDVAYSRKSNRLFAAAVVVMLPDFQVKETAFAQGRAVFPYIPGLLSFREAPVLLKALEKVCIEPDVVLVDGQGIAHPRGIGLAAHLGAFLNIPTIGCGKSRLVGEYVEPGRKKGDRTEIRYKGRRIGTVLRSREGVRPIFISPGNRIGFRRAEEVVLACLGRFRIPEPIRLAHIKGNEWARDFS